MKLFNIRKVMGYFPFPFTKRGYHAHFSVVLKLKKLIFLENKKSNELSPFSKIVSKGLYCDKVWGISIF